MNKLLIFFVFLASPVWAQELDPPEVTTQAPTDKNAAEPIGENGIQGEPVLYFGYKTCTDEVLWVLLASGHFILFDATHHPKDMRAFRKQLQGLPNDLHEKPCASI